MMGFHWLLSVLFITAIQVTASLPVSRNESSDENEEIILVTIYDTLTLQCNQSINSTNASITWYHNDEPIKSSHGNDLVIPNFKESDIGTYQCITQIKNDHHPGKRSIVKLKPYLEVSAADAYPLRISQAHAHKKHFKVVCFVQSYPPADVIFYRNNERINPSARITMDKSVISSKDDNVVKYKLVMSNITAADIGDYYCKITNGHKTEKVYVNSISVEVTCNENNTWRCPFTDKCVSKFSCEKLSDCVLYYCENPFPPRNFRILSRNHDSISLTWDRGDRVLEYLIKLKSDNMPTIYLQTEENIVRFKNLKNNTEYLFQISAMNKAGKTGYENFRFRTKRMVPPEKVDEFEVLRHDLNDEVLLKWTPPFDDGMENRNGDVRYELSYCIYHKESERKEECELKYTHDTSIKVANVKDGSLYNFKLRTINKANQFGKPNEFFYTYKRKNKEPENSSGSTSKSCLMFLFATIFITDSLLGGN